MAKGYEADSTPTFMVFVDRKLQDQQSGLLRGDRLRAFLDRWGFTDNEPQPDDADRTDDDFNPWSNPRRWNRGPIRDRIDNAKSKFAWWLLGKWLGFGVGGAAIVLPWLIVIYRALRKVRDAADEECPSNKPQLRRRPPKRPQKPPRRRKPLNPNK